MPLNSIAKNTLVLFLLVFFTNSGYAQSDSGEKEGKLIFNSGFEGSVRVVPRGKEADIIGQEPNLRKSDWEKDLDENPDIGVFTLQFQGGDSTMRNAKIVPDPTNAENQVLMFSLKAPNVSGYKGRVQANLYGNPDLREVYESVKVFLSPDFRILCSCPGKIDWLTIEEFWNDITWSPKDSLGFRITLGIGKPKGFTKNLYFTIKAENYSKKDGYSTLWAASNREVSVPINSWFTLKTYFKEGDYNTGRFYVAIQSPHENEKIVYDIHNYTHNSFDLSPDGLMHFNPLKLYTSKQIIEYMKKSGKELKIYWDDFELWKNIAPQ